MEAPKIGITKTQYPTVFLDTCAVSMLLTSEKRSQKQLPELGKKTQIGEEVDENK